MSAEFDIPNDSQYGLSGSATQVERIFPPEVNNERVIWEGNPGELSGKIMKVLKEAKFIYGGGHSW